MNSATGGIDLMRGELGIVIAVIYRE